MVDDYSSSSSNSSSSNNNNKNNQHVTLLAASVETFMRVHTYVCPWLLLISHLNHVWWYAIKTLTHATISSKVLRARVPCASPSGLRMVSVMRNCSSLQFLHGSFRFLKYDTSVSISFPAFKRTYKGMFTDIFVVGILTLQWCLMRLWLLFKYIRMRKCVCGINVNA